MAWAPDYAGGFNYSNSMVLVILRVSARHGEFKLSLGHTWGRVLVLEYEGKYREDLQGLDGLSCAELGVSLFSPPSFPRPLL
jgi:hypothetical protein